MPLSWKIYIVALSLYYHNQYDVKKCWRHILMSKMMSSNVAFLYKGCSSFLQMVVYLITELDDWIVKHCGLVCVHMVAGTFDNLKQNFTSWILISGILLAYLLLTESYKNSSIRYPSVLNFTTINYLIFTQMWKSFEKHSNCWSRSKSFE